MSGELVGGYARKAKPRPRLEAGWEVEWCANVPKVKDDDGNDTEESDLDAADIRIRDFATLEAARTFARQVFPKDWFGSVRITRFHMELYEAGYTAKFKEYDGEPEYYEGDDAASGGGK